MQYIQSVRKVYLRKKRIQRLKNIHVNYDYKDTETAKTEKSSDDKIIKVF